MPSIFQLPKPAEMAVAPSRPPIRACLLEDRKPVV
jgi:hypothetical protein